MTIEEAIEKLKKESAALDAKLAALEKAKADKPKPCTACGHCPSCGHTPAAAPYWRGWYQPLGYPYSFNTTNAANLSQQAVTAGSLQGAYATAQMEHKASK
jgi:hypothetical protein